MALTGKEFVKKVADYIEPLFKSSEEQTQAYFRNDPDLDEAIFNFKRRMFNERMNIVEIGKTLVEKPASTDPNHLKLLSKQVYDEAKHYDMVRNVIEYLRGEKFTDAELEQEYAWQMDKANVKQKGASLFDEIGGDTNPVMAAVYQYVAEGRASRVWNAMATSIDDEVVSTSYAKIAKDEHFHSMIGAKTLMKECDGNQEAQDAVMAVLPKMMERMFWINCQGTAAVKSGAERCSEFYGFDASDEKMSAMGKAWVELKDASANWKPVVRGAFKKHDPSDEMAIDNFSFA